MTEAAAARAADRGLFGAPLALALALALACAGCHGNGSGNPDAGSAGGGDGGVHAHPHPGPGQSAAWQVTDPQDLIGGPSSKGRVGDWVLANGNVRFLLEGARASDGYDPYGGSILAADLQRDGGPGESRFGEVWMGLNFRTAGCDEVTLVDDGSSGEAAHLRVVGHDEESPFMASLFEQQLAPPSLKATLFRDYQLAPDSPALELTLTIRNDGETALALSAPYIGMAMNRGLRHWVPKSGFNFNSLTAVNPSAEFYAAVGDRVSYSVLELDAPFSPILDFAKVLIGQYPQVTIPVGQARAFSFAIAVGSGDVGSLQEAHAKLRGVLSAAAPISGTVKGPGGDAVGNARVHIALDSDHANEVSLAQTRPDGSWSAALPSGTYWLSAVADDRPYTSSKLVTLTDAGLTGVALTLGGTGRIDVSAVENGAPVPVKIVAEPSVANGRQAFPISYGEWWARQPVVRFSASGSASLPVFPGTWKVTVSRGFEYDAPAVNVTVAADGIAPVDVTLHRVVDTTGWLSGDFHVHAQFSPDADDLLPLKVAAFAGEGVEVPVSTEHEFISDFGPAAAALDLGRFMHTVTGTELTTTYIGHFNIFPLAVQGGEQNAGAFNWYDRAIPDVLDEARGRLQGTLVPLVQMNHPRTPGMGYLDAVQFEPSSFLAGINAQHYTTRWDAMEVWNGTPLEKFEGCPTQALGCVAPAHATAYDWFAWLSRARRLTGTGNSDSHSASLREVGYPRTYVKVGTDDPAALTDTALLAGLRAMKVTISGGPFLTISAPGAIAGTSVDPGGIAPADLTGGSPIVHLGVDVQAPLWMGPLSRLDIWQGDTGNPSKPGKIVRSVDLTQGPYKDTGLTVRRLSATFDLATPVDTWLLATVRGPVDANGFSNALWPVVQGPVPPFAITNPIWVDANHDGVITPLIP